MFTNILVGIDGGPGGQDALALARHVAEEDAELRLAHFDIKGPLARWGVATHHDPAEKEQALKLLEAVREHAGIDATLHAAVSSSVGRGLHELAEHTGADLIVVGSSARGLLGRVLLGDDTQASLNGASCAVAVAPAGYAHRTVVFREIGVGYNGSPESEYALEVARELASERGVILSAFEAVSLPVLAFDGGDGAIRRDLDRAVKAARERIAALGDVEPHAAYGEAADELALYGASLDMLVIGSRGYGPLGRLVNGSTACRLARTARCPLLVLPRVSERVLAHVGPNGNHDVTTPSPMA